MDPFTYVMVLSMVALLARGIGLTMHIQLSQLVRTRFSAKSDLNMTIGGLWFALVGAPLAAWFLLTFWIAPLLNIQAITNIQSVLAFTNAEAVLIFLFLWLGIAFGFFGGTVMYERHKRGKR